MELPEIRPRMEYKESKIMLGDWRDVLATAQRADVVITDPPYNIGFKYNSHDDSMTESEYIMMIRGVRGLGKSLAIIQYPEETMKYIVPALGSPDDVIAWCYSSNINRRFRLISIYGEKPDFSKVLQPYKNPNDKRVRALIESGKQGTPVYDWWHDIQLVKNVSKEKGIHPCPIPEKLAERIIKIMSCPGQIILDPFAGGGTIPCMAKRLGRIGIGVEKDEKYFEYARNRMGD